MTQKMGFESGDDQQKWRISAKSWDVTGLKYCIPPLRHESSQGIPRFHIRWGNGNQPSKGHGSEKLVAQGHEANWTHNPSGLRVFSGSQLAMKTRKWQESGTRSQPFGQAAKLPGSKTAESPSVPASEPHRTQWLQWFDSFDLPYFTHGFRWRWIYGWSSPKDMGSHRLFSTFWPSHGTVHPKPSRHGPWFLCTQKELTSYPTLLGSIWNFEFQISLKSDISSWSWVETYGCCPFLLPNTLRPRTGAACAHTGKRSRQSELGQGKIVAIWRSTGWRWMDIRIHLYKSCIYGYPHPLVSFTLLLWKITVLHK